MYDKKNGPPKVFDKDNCAEHLSICCHDITEPMGDSVCPNETIGKQVFEFFSHHRNNGTDGGILCCCERGIGLAAAMVASCIRMDGGDPTRAIRTGIMNRKLYNCVIQAAGLTPLVEPLVSIMTMANYPAEYLHAFLLSLRRQRYENWEAVVVSNGTRPDIEGLVQGLGDQRVRFIMTKEHTGFWGHDKRQMGIDMCRGEVIGLQNDDNYIVPGYIEQLMFPIEDGAQLVLCNIVHSYMGYCEQQTKPVKRYCDLSSWLAKAELVRKCPWPGGHLEADGEMIERMAAIAGPDRVAFVRKPLLVHN